MAGKFIPDSDSAFADMARTFATVIAQDPQKYFLDAAAAAEIGGAVARYRGALAVRYQRERRTPVATTRKDAARADAERVIRRYANLIRANDAIGLADKQRLAVRVRPARLRRRQCPGGPPFVQFVRAEAGVHVLRFAEALNKASNAKPAGAARLEVFVEHVPPGRAIPRSPAELGGRAWYLRSYTTTPMKVRFPEPAGPAMVVYWARWASATGEVGRFCPTVQARVEGWPAERAAA